MIMQEATPSIKVTVDTFPNLYNIPATVIIAINLHLELTNETMFFNKDSKLTQQIGITMK